MTGASPSNSRAVSWTEIPRNSNRRRMASSIRLFGQEAPAVMPTVIFPGGQPVVSFHFLMHVLVVMTDQFV